MALNDIVSKEDVKNIVWNVFNPQRGENVIILNDMPDKEEDINPDFIARRQMVKDWHDIFSEEGAKHSFSVEPMITYLPTGKSGAPLPQSAVQGSCTIDLQKKLEALTQKDIVLAITKYSATAHLFPYAERPNGCRAASMPGAHMGMSAFKADYKAVKKKAGILASLLSKAELGVVEFSTGHRCYFDLRGGKCHADDGDCSQPGQAINLPSGEAYKVPYENKDSKGELGVSLTKGELPHIIDGNLVVYEVLDNRIVNVSGSGASAEELKRYFLEDPARANIAEFACGCNDMAVPIGSVLQDEKIEGFHWAYGRSDHLGGKVGLDDFMFKQMAVHQDVVYGKGLAIGIDRLYLIDSSNNVIPIINSNTYAVNFE